MRVETFFLEEIASLTFLNFYATFFFRKKKGKRYPKFLSLPVRGEREEALGKRCPDMSAVSLEMCLFSLREL